MGSELEALRIDVMQGQAQEALPAIESHLDEIRGWWQATLQGQQVADAPDREYLARALISALDIARSANLRLEAWQACLDLLTENEEVERALGQSEHELARTRFNRYGPLLRLGRLDEAQQVLEGCLATFREADDLVAQATTLSALASLWNQLGDVAQAVTLAEQALTVHNRLPDPSNRAMSHGNLSNYLHKQGNHEESVRHQLASGIYFFTSGYQQYFQQWMSNLAIHIRMAAESAESYELPQLAEVLAQPAFQALAQWLDDRQVDLVALQGQIDGLVAAVSTAD
ncbi:tetratricopeptide repeat protein [Chloroflexi bacterium TSY]|nr:tetratricopeptide repeat protein [Chloroflexi bacterium TSY]